MLAKSLPAGRLSIALPQSVANPLGNNSQSNSDGQARNTLRRGAIGSLARRRRFYFLKNNGTRRDKISLARRIAAAARAQVVRLRRALPPPPFLQFSIRRALKQRSSHVPACARSPSRSDVLRPPKGGGFSLTWPHAPTPNLMTHFSHFLIFLKKKPKFSGQSSDHNFLFRNDLGLNLAPIDAPHSPASIRYTFSSSGKWKVLQNTKFCFLRCDASPAGAPQAPPGFGLGGVSGKKNQISTPGKSYVKFSCGARLNIFPPSLFSFSSSFFPSFFFLFFFPFLFSFFFLLLLPSFFPFSPSIPRPAFSSS